VMLIDSLVSVMIFSYCGHNRIEVAWRFAPVRTGPRRYRIRASRPLQITDTKNRHIGGGVSASRGLQPHLQNTPESWAISRDCVFSARGAR